VEVFLRFPKDDRPDKGTVFIKISPPGVQHRNVFALNTATDDAASRVAFFIMTKKRSSYAFRNGESPAIFRTNALADRILKGATNEEIAALPR
jgi:hypothetical protein